MSNERHHLLIRADASPKSGVGHVMRCLALAQDWQDLGGSVSFACVELPEVLRIRLAGENIDVCSLDTPAGVSQDAEETLSMAARKSAICLVTDSYHFGQRYHDKISSFPGTSLTVDDYGQLQSYRSSYVLNQNLRSSSSLYANRSENTKLLLGIEHALIRREFRVDIGNAKDSAGIISNVLVTLGGSDPTNSTVTVLEAIQQMSLEDVNFRIIAGPLHHNFERLKQLTNKEPQIELISSVDDMSEAYRWADLAITAAGSTNWEMCCYNLPRILMRTADNQSVIADFLAEESIALDLGNADDVTPIRVKHAIHHFTSCRMKTIEAASRCRKLSTQIGSKQVARILWPDLLLRNATTEDMSLYFRWANEANTRANSINSDPITWETHISWFPKKLSDKNTHLFLAEIRDQPVGQIRFDKVGEDVWQIGFSLSSRNRGKGLGRQVLEHGILAMQKMGAHHFLATVKHNNIASNKCFQRLGFKRSLSNDSGWYTYTRRGDESKAIRPGS